MSATASFTDNDRSVSQSSQDDRSQDSIRTTNRHPRRNPYKNKDRQTQHTITSQQLYTATTWATQPSIRQWLKQGNNPRKPEPKPPHLPTKLRTKRQPKRTLQPTLTQLLTNDHWGDIPTTNPVHFRVISKNVNSLSTAEHNLQWRSAVQAMLDMDAHVLCVQEPNLNWNDTIRQPIYRLFQRAFMHAKLSTSHSIEHNQGQHQPGGTFLTTLGCYAA